MTRCMDDARSLGLISFIQAWRVQVLINHQTQSEKKKKKAERMQAMIYTME